MDSSDPSHRTGLKRATKPSAPNPKASRVPIPLSRMVQMRDRHSRTRLTSQPRNETSTGRAGEHLSILDLARIHHTVLLEVLKTHRTPNELEHIAGVASEFLVEALAVFEMTQRGGLGRRAALQPSSPGAARNEDRES